MINCYKEVEEGGIKNAECESYQHKERHYNKSIYNRNTKPLKNRTMKKLKSLEVSLEESTM